MKYTISLLLFVVSLCLASAPVSLSAADVTPVPLYRVFERSVINQKAYTNKFTDVTLEVTYTSPSGRTIPFYGFFDGDGKGSGDFESGNIWKMRFMPDELGDWTYVYCWSDGSKGGQGSFECVSEGSGKGILKAYEQNPRWLAYNGKEPVWLKSYYETGHGSLGQDFQWVADHVYQPLIDHGYNHLQVNWLLSLCCFGQYYLDGPEPETTDLLLYREGDPATTMNLDVWKRMERHLGWLNDRDVGVHMFVGFDGSKNDSSAWKALSEEDKDFFVRYVVSRIAPYANLAGWNYVWEVPGDRPDEELGWARLVMKYDVFDHLRTYEDECPRENEFKRPEYNFAAVENHRIASYDKSEERHLLRSAWTHHMACIVGYEGKPVYMTEGNSLWRRYWQERVGATQIDLLRSAWACATAGASFTWNGHAKEYELFASGPEGLPFSAENPYRQSEEYMRIIADVMTNEVHHYTMAPHDEWLSKHEVLRVYCLAEPGKQYLVFATDGEPFALHIEPGTYGHVAWIDAQTGERRPFSALEVTGQGEAVDFAPPSKDTDWVLIVTR